jgi:hypothetical protein
MPVHANIGGVVDDVVHGRVVDRAGVDRVASMRVRGFASTSDLGLEAAR